MRHLSKSLTIFIEFSGQILRVVLLFGSSEVQMYRRIKAGRHVGEMNIFLYLGGGANRRTEKRRSSELVSLGQNTSVIFILLRLKIGGYG